MKNWKLKFSNNDSIFFTADLHLGHSNIIKYCNRPFDDVIEMNKAIVNNWNEVIDDNSHVFILGDFAFASSKDTIHFIKSLKGIKYLIAGNHDFRCVLKNKLALSLFKAVEQCIEITVRDNEIGSDQKIVLSHYAGLTWNKSHMGSWQLFGHSHGTLQKSVLSPRQLDVGVDVHNFTPVSYNDIKIIITKQCLANEK